MQYLKIRYNIKVNKFIVKELTGCFLKKKKKKKS